MPGGKRECWNFLYVLPHLAADLKLPYQIKSLHKGEEEGESKHAGPINFKSRVGTASSFNHHTGGQEAPMRSWAGGHPEWTCTQYLLHGNASGLAEGCLWMSIPPHPRPLPRSPAPI